MPLPDPDTVHRLILEKVPEASLRDRMEQGGGALRVLISPDLLFRHVEVAKAASSLSLVARPALRIAAESDEALAENRRRTEATRALLRGLLPTEPVWLDSSRAFVAEAEPVLLARILESPLVRAVWADQDVYRPDATPQARG